MTRGWILAASLSLVGLASGCHRCEMCESVGGPCGYYSLAGREHPPVVEETKAPSSMTDPKGTIPKATSPAPATKPVMPPTK